MLTMQRAACNRVTVARRGARASASAWSRLPAPAAPLAPAGEHHNWVHLVTIGAKGKLSSLTNERAGV